MTAPEIREVASYASLAKAMKRKKTDITPAQLIEICDIALLAKSANEQLDWLEDHAMQVFTDDAPAEPWYCEDHNSLRDWISGKLEEEARERDIANAERQYEGRP